MLEGRTLAPFELYDSASKSLHFVGYEGLCMIAVSGLDMAAWDALAKAAGLPLCVLLGGSVGPVKSYNSNGLWLREPEAVAAEAIELRDEGGFTGLELRLGRELPRDDLATVEGVRKAVGDDMHLMVDFNQGLNLAEALQRCHLIDDLGLDWIEEPIVYDNLDGSAQPCRRAQDPDPDWRKLLWSPRPAPGAAKEGVRPCNAGFHAHRRRHGLAQGCGHRRSRRGADVHAPLSRGRRSGDAGDRDRALARMAGLGRSHSAESIRSQGRPIAHPQ